LGKGSTDARHVRRIFAVLANIAARTMELVYLLLTGEDLSDWGSDDDI